VSCFGAAGADSASSFFGTMKVVALMSSCGTISFSFFKFGS
jgi:hypothetical protein